MTIFNPVMYKFKLSLYNNTHLMFHFLQIFFYFRTKIVALNKSKAIKLQGIVITIFSSKMI